MSDPSFLRFETIIFDLDGTLVDSLHDIAVAANRALAISGMEEHPVDDYRHFVGDGLSKLVERIAPAGSGAGDLDRLAVTFTALYREQWHQTTRPYPGVVPMLKALREAGLNLAVLSNKPDEFTRLCVGRLLPGIDFTGVYGQRSALPKKPDPAAALLIAESTSAPPARCLIVGDTGVDMRTAAHAGMSAAGVSWGFRHEQELRDAGAAIIIDQPAELTEYVLCSR